MNAVQKIATLITQRANSNGWKGRKGDELSYEAWVGAYMGMTAAEHPETEHVGTIVSMIIAVRGLSETRKIAAYAAEKAASTEEVA